MGISPVQPDDVPSPEKGKPDHKAPHYQPTNANDAWAQMFGAMGATPDEVEKFKEGVMNAVNEQMKHDTDRQLRTLKKMREEQ